MRLTSAQTKYSVQQDGDLRRNVARNKQIIAIEIYASFFFLAVFAIFLSTLRHYDIIRSILNIFGISGIEQVTRTARQDRQSRRVQFGTPVLTARQDGCAKSAPVLTARLDGPLKRSVKTGSANRPTYPTLQHYLFYLTYAPTLPYPTLYLPYTNLA